MARDARPATPPVDRGPAPSERERERRVGVTLAGRTDVPLFAGGQVSVEHGPTRLRLSGAFGVLPGGYGRVVNDALTRAGAYDPRLGRALDGTLGTGLAWNLHAGFRPFARHGLLLEAGFGSATLVADGDARDLVAREIGATIPTVDGVDTSFAFRSTLQLVDGRIGWEWLLGGHVTLATTVGVTRVVGVTTTLEQPYVSRAPALAQNAIASSLGTLDDAFTRFGWIPTAGLAAGYRF